MSIAEITIAFCDVANLKGILDGVEATRHLKTVVTFEKVTDQSIVERCIKLDLKVLEFSELLVRIKNVKYFVAQNLFQNICYHLEEDWFSNYK